MAMQAIKTKTERTSNIVGNWIPENPTLNKETGTYRPGKRLLGVAILERQTGGEETQHVVLVEECVFPETKKKKRGELINFIECHGDEARKNLALFQRGPDAFHKVCELRAAKMSKCIFTSDLDGVPTYSKVEKSDLAFMFLDGECLRNPKAAHPTIAARILSGELITIIDCSQEQENQDLFDLI
jgi:hypothetical protein